MDEDKQEQTKSQVYNDKIKLAAFFLTKEDLLVHYYSKIIAFVRGQQMFEINVIEEQNEWTNFWQQFQQLYDLTKNDYLASLNKEQKTQIKSISDKYADVEQKLTLNEASMAKDLILKIMSGSGFHSALRSSEDDDFK